MALARNCTRIATFLNGTWPPWASNVANVVQIGSPAIALLAVWLAKVARSRSTVPGVGVAARLLGLLALLLPARDRERFVGEVLGNMAGLRWRQRVEELLSVAGCGFRVNSYGRSDRIRTPIPGFSYTPGGEGWRVAAA